MEKVEEERERLKRTIKDLTERRNEAPTRNESRYDSTRAELQYVLNGYKKRLLALESSLSELRYFAEKVEKTDRVKEGSLVSLSNGLKLLVLPVFGGETVEVDGEKVNIITPKTPIYAVMEGKGNGDRVRLLNGTEVVVEDVR